MKNFVASGVDAIIVNIVDTSAGAAITAAAGDTPLVYVNREPDNVNELPATQAFVASNEIESGTLSHSKFVTTFVQLAKPAAQLVT